ncbi:MAG: hypothetical protein AAB584_02370 [Patescibacteria group bacterium]
MQLLLFVSIVAAVVLLGMVLLVPWLEQLSWSNNFACPMPTSETPRQTPVGPDPHRNQPEPVESLASSAANP